MDIRDSGFPKILELGIFGIQDSRTSGFSGIPSCLGSRTPPCARTTFTYCLPITLFGLLLYAYIVDLISSINNKVNSNRHNLLKSFLKKHSFSQTLNINGSNIPCGPLMMYIRRPNRSPTWQVSCKIDQMNWCILTESAMVGFLHFSRST